MTNFHQQKQQRIDEQTQPEEISLPIVNCTLAGAYVSALQHPDGSIRPVICKESTTGFNRIQVENNICFNATCRNCERR